MPMAASSIITPTTLYIICSDCGLVTYMDRQLAGAWGNGARMYRNGPFFPAKAEYGYQLPLTPREYFAAGIRAAHAWSQKTYGKSFDHGASFTTQRVTRAGYDPGLFGVLSGSGFLGGSNWQEI